MADFLDTIREKREASRLKQEDEQNRKSQIEAVVLSSDKLGATFAQQSARSRINKQPVQVTNFPSIASPKDMEKLASAIKEVLEANTSEHNEKYEELFDKLSTLATSIENQPKPPKASDFPKPLKTVSVDNLPDFKAAIQPLVDAIESKDYNPVFNPNIEVKEPVVNIAPPDLSRLEELFTKEDEPEEIELEDFKAQDIDTEAGSLQYVGLQDSKGNWQLIELDIEKNSMRYCFGMGKYEDAWGKRVSTTYKYLAEAYSAFSS